MLFLGSGLRSTAAAAAVALAAPVFAEAPNMLLTVSTPSFGKSIPLAANSVSASGIGTYYGSAVGTNGISPIWNCNYNFSAASGADFASQSGSFSITNTSGSTMAFLVMLALPTSASQQMTGLFSGNMAAALITNSSTGGVGSMAPVGTSPLWTATSGGSPVASMLSTWSAVTRSAPGASLIGSASFGGSQPSQPADVFGDSIVVTLHFELSNNATASFTSTLSGVGSPVPAPGALALLGTAGFVARRRRR